MTVNPFDSPNLLLERAREHREELNSRAKRFFDENPCDQFVDRDPDSSQYLRKAKMAEPFPASLWPIAADAFNNLRSALDQAVCASVSLLRPSASLKRVSFCFGTSQAHFENTVGAAPETIDPYVFDVMRLFQPYHGGNDRLAALNVIANANKHRGLISLGASVDSVEVAVLEMPRNGPMLRPYWDSAKNELVITRTRDNIKPSYDLDVTFFIAFDHVKGLEGAPVIPTIDYLASVCACFVDGLESDTQRMLVERG